MANRPGNRELERLYRRLGTIAALAAELGVAFETARRWLADAGIRVNPKGRPSRSAAALSSAELVTHYKAGESIATIGEAYGVSPATVRSRLIDAGVELRPRRGWKY